MNAPPARFTVGIVAFEAARSELHAVRGQVFIDEQGVPAGIERDAADPGCTHVLARDATGRAIGAARISPDGRIGRMAVVRDWRGRGVGKAMLRVLLDHARAEGLAETILHAQAPVIDFYARLGFSAVGERFQEGGIEHQAMQLPLAAAAAGPIDTINGAIAATAALIAGARNRLRIHTRELDPELLDAGPVLEALRRFAVGGSGREVQILLHDPAAPQRAHAPLLVLAQRLPSVFQFRAVDDPVDHAYTAAFLANDTGGYYFRSLGHRFDGYWDPAAPGRARQLIESFKPVWERSRPCTELRALGL